MLPTRVYYVRISDDRQDFLRQVNGLKELAKKNGDDIPDSVWQAVIDRKPLPPSSPVLWDEGSRDMVEQRPHFQRIIQRVSSQNRKDPRRLKEVCIYELDRFGVKGPKQWFHYLYVFEENGCRIVSYLNGDLTAADDDLKSLVEQLFQTMNSRAEQKKIAGRVAAGFAARAANGEFLGGVPRYGYDLGCFDKDRLVWRLHYRDISVRIQITATEDNPLALLVEDAQVVEYRGKDNYPKKSKEQKYKLVPSLDTKRVEGVKFLFKTYKTHAPTISGCELARQMNLMGYTSYNARSFDGDNLLLMLEDDTYIGVRPHGKRSVARHKRYNKSARDDDGRHLEDVADDQKGKTVWRDKADWIMPESRTHEALVDAETFQAVQELLAERPKRGRSPYGPRTGDGWLKPIVYCAGCGRQMIATRSRGHVAYHCVNYNYRYQRPGDPRYQCDAGFNSIRHDELVPLVEDRLDEATEEISGVIEQGAIKRLEAEVAQSEAVAAQGATTGFKTHLKVIWDTLDLGNHPGPLSKLIEKLLETDGEQERLDGLAEVEGILPSVVGRTLDQCKVDYRHCTLAMARPGVTERQLGVYQEECIRLDERMAALEGLLTPYQEQVEILARDYREKLAQLEDAKRVLAEGNNRAKAAVLAVARHRIIVWPRAGESRRTMFLPWFNPDGNTPVQVVNYMIGLMAGRPYPYRRESSEDRGGEFEDLSASSASSSSLRNRWPSGCLPFWVHGSPRM